MGFLGVCFSRFSGGFTQKNPVGFLGTSPAPDVSKVMNMYIPVVHSRDLYWLLQQTFPVKDEINFNILQNIKSRTCGQM